MPDKMSIGGENLYAQCLAECGDRCRLQEIRNGLALAALAIDEVEPEGGSLTDGLRVFHEAVASVCIKQQMNVDLLPIEDED